MWGEKRRELAGRTESEEESIELEDKRKKAEERR